MSGKTLQHSLGGIYAAEYESISNKVIVGCKGEPSNIIAIYENDTAGIGSALLLARSPKLLRAFQEVVDLLQNGKQNRKQAQQILLQAASQLLRTHSLSGCYVMVPDAAPEYIGVFDSFGRMISLFEKTETNRLNAYLLASAPKLYNVCLHTIEYLEKNRQEYGYKKMIDNLQAAIKEATGAVAVA